MTGLNQFLQKYARRPDVLRGPLSAVRRMPRFNNDDIICQIGDPAECVWIIEDGIVVVGEGSKIVRRYRGDLIGEIAFLRRDAVNRSTTMKADGIVTLWEIDRSFIDKFSSDEKSEWFETLAAVLADKIIQATDHRSQLIAQNIGFDHVLRKFVCKDGLMAVNAALTSNDLKPIEPQRTDALVWFSDIAGFSTFSKDMQPDKAGLQMRRFMEIQVEEVQKADGEIDKFLGDGLMAFWRLPDANRISDRIPRAVESALRSIERVHEIIKNEKLPLDIRIGLHMGPVVVGDFGGSGRIAYTLMGETVNSASRYEQARTDVSGATLGALRISEPVYLHIADPALRNRFASETVRFLAKGGQEFVAHTSTDRILS